MYTPRRILAPVDFGAGSQSALAEALAIVRKPRATGVPARLHILHVYEPPYYAPEALVNLPGEPPLPMVDYVRQQAEAQLDEFMAPLLADPELKDRVDARLLAGLAFEEIPREGAAWNADLVVMGTHGRKGISHWLLGSVAERVIRRAPCPVLVVRPTTEAPPPEPLAFDQVLVPVDFGPDSVPAARLGITMGVHGARSVTLLHVVPTPAYAGDVLVPRAGGVRLGDFLHDEAQQRLEGFAREVARSPDEVPAVSVQQGSPAEQVLRYALDHGTRLLVMGTKGRHGLAHLFLGSVAERVLRNARCPVLITRSVFGEVPQSPT